MLAALLPQTPVLAQSDGTSNDCFHCTQVIGYSQVGAANGWFVRDGVFESIVGNDSWQLLWNNGATLEDWQDVNHPYWSNALVSPCATNAAAPDRVLLNLSAQTYDTNVTDWINGIDATINTIALKYPSVRRIILQPILGGPGHQLCEITGQVVRASSSHPIMDEAISAVVAARTGTLPEVVAGISPEVRDCTDYNDTLGHLTREGAVASAQLIGESYAALDAGCASDSPCPLPVPSIHLLSTSQAALRWQTCEGEAYQVEWSDTFGSWRALGPPQAAVPGAGWLTNVVDITLPREFFRLQALSLSNSPVPEVAGSYTELNMIHDSLRRTYRLEIPPGYSADEPAPLAFILHGSGQTGDEFANRHPDLVAYARARGLILVLPTAIHYGRGTLWSGFDPLPGEFIADDVGYLLALLEQLDGALNIDRKRVYAGGFSGGAVMTHYLGARTTNVFAALAASEGTIGLDRDEDGTIEWTPPPAGPMPVLLINATNSCAVTYWGGVNDSGRLQAAAVDGVSHWTNANGCVSATFVHTNTVVTNGVYRFNADCSGPYPPPLVTLTNQVITQTWIDCTNGAEVVFVTLSDGGHTWPDRDDNLGYDANREVLDFFLRHCRCDAPGGTNTLIVPATPGMYNLAICDQSYWRKVGLMVPSGYSGAVETPLLFTFHGGAETVAEFTAQHPNLIAKCNAEGLFLVLPEATIHPQSRDTLWGNKPFDIVVDDRVFVTRLLDQLDDGLNLDRKRIYAAGFSNGGRFCNWFAATWPGVLAGIAPVCSQIGWNDPVSGALVAPPMPLEPLPVIMVRGSLDPRQPFFGGTNNSGQLTFSAAQDLAFWANANLCTPPPITNTVGVVSSRHFTTCAGGTEALLEGVSGLGHEWPESAAYNASLRIVDFLLPFSRP